VDVFSFPVENRDGMMIVLENREFTSENMLDFMGARE